MFGGTGGYFRLDSWILANIVQLATQDFCQKSSKPMTRRKARTGKNAGNPFWGCTAYPDCKGTLKMEDKT